MTLVQWSKRHGKSITLSAGDRMLAEFVLNGDSAATAQVVGKTWTYELEEASARASNGEVEWVVNAPKPFKKTKRFVATMGERSIDFINEQRSDWIIDENDVKLGQFSGGNHGVREVVVDFEDDVNLEEEQLVFLAWLARITLEQRLVGSTWALTISLAVLSLLGLLVFFT